jgi:hypothetical protein
MAHQLQVQNMNLDDAQKKLVASWIAEGLKVGDIQKRLDKELGVTLTYMEVRFLLDDLKVVPKDPPPPPPKPVVAPDPANANPAPDAIPDDAEGLLPEDAMPGTGKVSLSIDKIAKPGAMVSGNVTFSDGNESAWYVDQYGRLGLAPKVKGYRPSPEDVQEFQAALQAEMSKGGY